MSDTTIPLEKLEPCPFCGGTNSYDNATMEPKVDFETFVSAGTAIAVKVSCACGASGKAFIERPDGRGRAANWWTTRAISATRPAVRPQKLDGLAEQGVEVLRRLSVAKLSLSDASFLAGWVTDARTALRALSARPATEVKATHRHKKRDTEYVLIGIGKMQAQWWYEPAAPHGEMVNIDMREVAIYRSVDDGSLWARPIEEFNDGRFSALTSTAKETE